MKKLLFLLLFIPLVSFGQEDKELELRYHLLDDELNEVILKNPNVISTKERRRIYNYVEYYVLGDSISGPITYYYVKGKEPYWINGLYEYYNPSIFSNEGIKVVISSTVKFKNPENRSGSRRSYGYIRNKIPPKIWKNTEYSEKGEWKTFHPNGNLYLVKYDKTIENKIGGLVTIQPDRENNFKQYYPTGELHIERVTEGEEVIKYIYYKNGDLKNKSSYNKYTGEALFKPRMSAGVRIITQEQVEMEESIKKYFDDTVELDPIEGIWIFSNSMNGSYGRSAIKKSLDGDYQEIYLEDLIRNATDNKHGQIIASVKKMAADGVYMFQENEISSTAILKGNVMEVFYAGLKALAIREYPMENTLKKKQVKVERTKNESSNDSKNNAIEELKKLKELLDLELITQDEFDKKSKELKKIILDN
tara:strand:+ start:23 stop:1282 length:1260 start_codon:yes stop_codon:yes gene_type:complete